MTRLTIRIEARFQQVLAAERAAVELAHMADCLARIADSAPTPGRPLPTPWPDLLQVRWRTHHVGMTLHGDGHLAKEPWVDWLQSHGAPWIVGEVQRADLLAPPSFFAYRHGCAVTPSLTREQYLQWLGPERRPRGEDACGAPRPGELHDAARAGQAGAVALLIAMGATVNARDGNGRTAAHVAATDAPDEVAAITCIERLQGAGALLDATDRDGLTPLQAAAALGRTRVCAYLRRYEALRLQAATARADGAALAPQWLLRHAA
jgi:hypothetical protein